ncbi:IS1634 family transposase [Streptomyces sp. NPDC002514]|uniref:IS1634 family transposase n=1 Tax=Streptomyces sp. NPDC001270 TaxID=3364554 RepID=UPI0036A1B669
MVEKRLGALPVAAEFLRRLDVAGTVDELCPGGPSAHLTHGQVVEVLVASRLMSPAPLVRVGDWARTWAVEEVFGIGPDLLNDDRLARALDAIAPELERIAGTVGGRAVAEFGVDVSRLHWDMTSMSVHGAFPDADQDGQYPVIGYGHPRDRRVDLKQVRAGLAVSADGGIPVHARVFGGGAAEVSQLVGAMKDLQGMAGEQVFLVVADSRLVSCANVTALLAAGVDFIAPVPAVQVKDEVCAALDLAQAQVVDWVPERDARKPAGEREVYRVLEDVHTLAGPRKRDPVHRVRRILIRSTVVAGGRRQARGKRLARAREEMDKLAGAVGGRHCKTPGKIAARAGVIAA